VINITGRRTRSHRTGPAREPGAGDAEGYGHGVKLIVRRGPGALEPAADLGRADADAAGQVRPIQFCGLEGVLQPGGQGILGDDHDLSRRR
jgi:hypothetical protein